ncbi:MAG: 6-phosphogluconolactonase [Deltaproteobacteria bacterium]|jgi:6-phosphogluconolactonase|nr:6-phosphogluconolactonase [Deltaproteobacteria bacterium]
MMETLVQHFKNVEQASIAAADLIIHYAKSAVSDKGNFTLVMAGGGTPQLTYELLGEPFRAEQMPWQQSHFFWGDERWVSATHPDSNYSMVHNTLFSKVHIPLQNIHQISTGHQSPEIGAEVYEKHLRDFFLSNPIAVADSGHDNLTFPSFDLVLLGMGTDGHTASLFPGSKLLDEKNKWVAAVTEDVGSPPIPRITLTLPVLNQAKNIIFLVAGNRKRKILDTFLHKQERQETVYPAARVKPKDRLIWIVAEKE